MNPEVAETTVNLQMVESIVQLIRSLPQPERNILNRRLSGELTEYPEVTTEEMMLLSEKGGSFDFWYSEPELYTFEDGEPIQW